MKILFIHQRLESYVQKDLDILRSVHQVRDIQFTGIKDIFAILQGTIWADLSFSWFGKLHAFFAVLFSKIFGKKAIVVAGGDDVVNNPEIKYGMFYFWWKKWCPLFVFKYADLVLTVSKSNTFETIKNAKVSSEKIKMIYHGFDISKYKENKTIQKANIALIVGAVDKEYITRKGIYLFVESAQYLPNVSFVIVGSLRDEAAYSLKMSANKNVRFTGYLEDGKLLKLMWTAKVYVQPSIHEAFGCSIAEAMLCECIPVVARNAAIPEVVGDCGYYVDNLTPENLSSKIKEAINSNLGKAARKRVESMFPIEKRQKQILKVIEKLL